MLTQNRIFQPLGAIGLDDKWDTDKGRILINGTQAIARVLIAQSRADRRQGLRTAGFVSGYRGSPLGNVDSTLWSIGQQLQANDIRFVPGVNEDLAATAVRGTQQLDFVPTATRDGVFAAWYGKGPGVDRSVDALKHGNFAGVHRNGGVLAFYGDDHGGKSSSVAHHSEQAMASALIPSLYPSNVREIIEYGLLGYAMSRYSGSWIAIKCVNEIVEQTASVDLDLKRYAPVLPDEPEVPAEGVHIRKGPYGPLRDEQIVTDYRLPLVQRFVRVNRIDRIVFKSPAPRLGLVVAGKSYGDTMAALDLLGLDIVRAGALGLSLYKVGCIWPLEPEGLVEFAQGHEKLFFIEEKKSFVELQAASILINQERPPRFVGKRDEARQPLLPEAEQVEPIGIALAILGRLERLGIRDEGLLSAGEALRRRLQESNSAGKPALPRSPYFCSGCPHNRSTRLPEGSLSMTGIGCHTMVSFVRPEEALLPTHMGGEGANWIGLAPYTSTGHIFQNMGDGTYYHSGLLAIRAAVAAGVNITYKILYNDAVAMTGGQPVDGPISVSEIAQQLRHEGVATLSIVSDNPDHYRNLPGLPDGIRIAHRDDLDVEQKFLRELAGCSVLIYEQTCAAEKRRRRKRGGYPDPTRRLFIAEAVCEGCGDCSVQSTCVSLIPTETEFGTKRQIDQSSCNKDYSCLNGFCPSFLTIDGAEPRRGAARLPDPALLRSLPRPPTAKPEQGAYNIMVAGIGGTGVVTVGAILGMAAHIEGRAASLFDMTGLAQKNGAVYSHIRIADSPECLYTQRLGKGEAHLLMAFDLVAALAPESASTFNPVSTRAVVNENVVPTSAFQFDRRAIPSGRGLLTALESRIGGDAVLAADAAALSVALLGNSIGANMFLIGAAAQSGWLPVGIEAIEEAVRLNGAAVELNLSALSLGRLYVVDRAALEALSPARPGPPSQTLEEIIERSERHLLNYQDARYAARYRDRVRAVEQAEKSLGSGSRELALAFSRNYARLLSYKDEYEVARLLTDPSLEDELSRRFEGAARISFNLAPPFLPGKTSDGRPRKRRFPAIIMKPVLRALARMKRLRGTPLDVFGYTHERRAERALILEYETTCDLVIGQLSVANHAQAVSLLALADSIRGFGPVKERAILRYQEARAEALRQFKRAGSVQEAA